MRARNGCATCLQRQGAWANRAGRQGDASASGNEDTDGDDDDGAAAAAAEGGLNHGAAIGNACASSGCKSAQSKRGSEAVQQMKPAPQRHEWPCITAVAPCSKHDITSTSTGIITTITTTIIIITETNG